MELVCTNGERDSRTKFTSPEFCTNQFVRVNGRQPLFCLINQLPLRRSRYRPSRYVVTHHRDLGNGHYGISAKKKVQYVPQKCPLSSNLFVCLFFFSCAGFSRPERIPTLLQILLL